MGNSNLTIILFLVVISYVVLYFGGRKYLEMFENEDGNRFKENGEPNTGLNTTIYPPEKPYLMNPIDDLDDYEYSVVFQNQGSKTETKQQINDAMTRYPMDWSSHGPGSQYFQENKTKYEEQQKQAIHMSDNIYKKIDGSDMIPMDTNAIEEEEKKILQTYKPESSKGLLQYSLDDVKHLVDKIYTKKGLIPVIEKSNQANNVWEITEVKEKDPHIVWEDDLERETERQKMEKRREEVIEIPYTVTDVEAGLDPFFNARQSVRDGRYDYYKWTPGLERMFAPTHPIKNWF